MATPAQIAANRRNALSRTGPHSEEGKAVSRFNALKTGIQANSQIIPGEDPAALAELADGFHLQFRPATPVERFLVDILVNADCSDERIPARVAGGRAAPQGLHVMPDAPITFPAREWCRDPNVLLSRDETDRLLRTGLAYRFDVTPPTP